MKNKQARQMMIDCGNMDLAIMMMQIEIGSKCDNLKRSGSYDSMTDMVRITKNALQKRKHLFKGVIKGKPYKSNNELSVIEIDLNY